jgi:hypothetical protein
MLLIPFGHRWDWDPPLAFEDAFTQVKQMASLDLKDSSVPPRWLPK